MNRAVERYWRNIPQKYFGFFLMYGLENYPEVCEKVKEKNSIQAGFPHPVPIVKYVLRKYPGYPTNDSNQRISLDQLKEPMDPLETVSFWKFNKTFAYDKEVETYVPLGDDIKGTRVMKRIYKKLEEKRVSNAWSVAKRYLRNQDGKEPTLDYSFEK